MKAISFPHYKQHDVMDCGPTCLQIISKYYGKIMNIEKLRTLSQISKSGVSLLGISKAAESIGIRVVGGRITFEKLKEGNLLPCIVHWKKNHFLVVYKVTDKKVCVSDPASGLIKYSKEEFLSNWISASHNNQAAGIALLLSPTTVFYENEDDVQKNNFGLVYLLDHILQYKTLVRQLLLALIAGGMIQVILPFLTKGIVDIGVKGNNMSFVYIILIGQLLMALGQTSVEMIRGWIVLHITARVNVSILSNFLHKLVKLPLSFFDTKLTGDILQRIDDHKRVEALMTGSSLNVLFSLITFSVFGVILYFYNPQIFWVFLLGSAVYFLWMYLFLEKRKTLDFKRFGILSQNHSKTLQLINGIHEIKINDCGTQKIWEWESVQAKLFQFNIKSLSLSQYQQVGSTFINQAKNIVILFLATKLVIKNEMSIGDMMAIQFIVGQMNSPIAQLATFLQTLQDAKISIERLGQVQVLEEEESGLKSYQQFLPAEKSIFFDNISFTYPGAGNKPALSNITLSIPVGKTTAIVGASGSGKTTLLKLFMRVYNPSSGTIYIGQTNLEAFSPQFWRKHCGIVMQDGFIFSDSIFNNIAVGSETDRLDDVLHATYVSNLDEYVQSLPLGLNTKIGDDGKGLSGGQKQRVLIARVVYKNPEYIFLDEATSALDAYNERMIVDRLNSFLIGKTVVIVAHRLSTVKNADNIIVLDDGKIVEQGAHGDLVKQEGYYFKLIKNQLELGN